MGKEERDPLEAVMAVSEPRREAREAAAALGADADAEPPAAAGETPAAPAAPENPAPPADDGYGEFEWPDGYVADPGAMAKFVPMAKKLGLSREGAQELAGLYAELDQAKRREQEEFIARNNAEWLREIRNHPEFGGKHLARTGEEVAAAMRRFGSPLLLAQIRQMNIQNWPEMFYFLARVSRAMSEDCSPASAGGAPPPKSTAQLLFPGLD